MHLSTLLTAAIAATPALAYSINDFACRSTTHPNPVVLLHGLGATWYEDLNYLQGWLQAQGYCTYAQTYGAYAGFPFLGGLRSINESAPEIAAYIREVQAETGASKVDLVGHSEGAFQSLYVPKFEAGVSELVDKIVAIAPPTRGTTFIGLYNLAYLFGNASREAVGEVLDTLGCPACDELGPDGAAVERLNDGTPIVQDGNSLTVIASKSDEMVTPTTTAFVHEDGVTNEWVQDTCPLDPVGHIGEAYDLNVWNLVKNALDETPDRKFVCLLGSPGK
ncbi:esterase/lipase family protein [Aspergillus saccharolyticus JOP 1030-1]|uniref:Lipase n=1 Tax=Aspergillus saccharolyticus JOP 1030-1 TaxID=1450539 RepID=A0A318Z7R8_9EURO|nr:lipase [Aspergillus saccharolyticus JOP 1030-1]PYH42474.1 lipase [Aspergillus saccharolyticus JOP 1030-1]